jgi:hypothetical protein
MKILIIQIELNWLGVIVMASMFAALEYGLYCIAQKMRDNYWIKKLGRDLKRMELL